MARLVDALQRLGLSGRVARSGRWVELEGERGRIYVVAARGDDAFYTWCSDPAEQIVEQHADPVEAIRSGLRRAARAAGERGAVG